MPMAGGDVVSTSKRRKKGKRKRRGPETTDPHRLYELSVQSPDEHIEFFDRIYEERFGRAPESLKEDFCGTALLSAHWVKTRPKNTAIAVDLDEETLQWGDVNNIKPLGADAKRVTVLKKNVLDVVEPKVDIVAALNFSYSVFKTRKDLCGYFKKAKESLGKDGIFIMDMFGGWDAQMEEIDATDYEGFTYEWVQDWYDPITHHTQFHIDFKFHGPVGGGIKKAFVYEWRLWMMAEVTELLDEAGFGNVDIYWEAVDEGTGEGNGEFDLVTTAESCPGWVAMVVARP